MKLKLNCDKQRFTVETRLKRRQEGGEWQNSTNDEQVSKNEKVE